MLHSQKFLFLIIIVSLLFTACSDSLVNNSKERFTHEFSRIPEGKDTVIKIDNRWKMTKQRFDDEREFLVSFYNDPPRVKKILNDPGSRAIQLENTLNQMLFISEGIKENMYDSDDFEKYLWLTIRDAMSRYYVLKKMQSAKINTPQNSECNPCEAKEIYSKFADTYSKMGMNREQALSFIEQKIISEKKAGKFSKLENQLLNDIKMKRNVEITGR